MGEALQNINFATDSEIMFCSRKMKENLIKVKEEDRVSRTL